MANLGHIFATVPNWESTSVQYYKHDIVTYNSFIYYALTDHVSDGSSFPSVSSAKWGGRTIYFNSENKPSFIWKPSYTSRSNFEPRVRLMKYGDGYEQRAADGINNNLLNVDYVFDLKNEDETLAILHFLDRRAGKESFVFTPPRPFGLAKLFTCPNWSEQYNFRDNHVINANFKEVSE